MHFHTSTFLALFFSLTSLAEAQDGPRATVTPAKATPTIPPADSEVTAKASQLISAISTFATSLTAQPAYSSVVLSLLGTSGIESVAEAIETMEPGLAATGYTTMNWFTTLPTPVQSYFKSAFSEEAQIVSSVLLGSASGAATAAATAAAAAKSGSAAKANAAVGRSSSQLLHLACALTLASAVLFVM